MKESQAQRILDVLSDGEKHRMEEIHQRAGFSRLNSRISELRKRGHVISCDKTGGQYVYQLHDSAAATAAAAPAPRIGADSTGRAPHNISAILERHDFVEVVDGQLALAVT